MSEFVIKENQGFRLKVSKNPCLRPQGLQHVEFIQEILTDGEVTATSTYQFFMTDAELSLLARKITE
jgi:hypothetical protein